MWGLPSDSLRQITLGAVLVAPALGDIRMLGIEEPALGGTAKWHVSDYGYN